MCRFIKEVRDKLRTGSTDSTCSLCVGGSEMKFEAPNIYCNGINCGVRIKRNAVYYANDNKRFQVRSVVAASVCGTCLASCM